MMDEEEKSDALEVLRFYATENGRKDPDDKGAKFQFLENIQGT